MIAVDTKVLVRFLVRDDEAQYQASLMLFQHNELYIPDSVVLETEWVLRYAYDYSPPAITSAFRGIFGLKNVRLEDAMLLSKAITWHETGLDFADALHLAKSEHLESLLTFDEKFAKRSTGLSSCKVRAP